MGTINPCCCFKTDVLIRGHTFAKRLDKIVKCSMHNLHVSVCLSVCLSVFSFLYSFLFVRLLYIMHMCVLLFLDSCLFLFLFVLFNVIMLSIFSFNCFSNLSVRSFVFFYLQMCVCLSVCLLFCYCPLIHIARHLCLSVFFANLVFVCLSICIYCLCLTVCLYLLSYSVCSFVSFVFY